MSITAHVRPPVVMTLAVVGLLALAGCSSAGGSTGDASPTSSPVPAESGTSTPAAGDDIDEASGETVDALAERDAFIADQQQPVGQPTLTAKTPAQQELVAQQQAHLEANGGQWSEQAETVTLALGLDACETSILNGHEIDLAAFRTHVVTSPLIDSLAVDDASREGAVSIMVFGTRFLCPDDAPQWEQAWTESGGEY